MVGFLAKISRLGLRPCQIIHRHHHQICFMVGTLIRTPGDETPVQELKSATLC